MTSRDAGANWAFVTEKQRRQSGCPAWESFRKLLCYRTLGLGALDVHRRAQRVGLPTRNEPVDRIIRDGWRQDLLHVPIQLGIFGAARFPRRLRRSWR